MSNSGIPWECNDGSKKGQWEGNKNHLHCSKHHCGNIIWGSGTHNTIFLVGVGRRWVAVGNRRDEGDVDEGYVCKNGGRFEKQCEELFVVEKLKWCRFKKGIRVM